MGADVRVSERRRRKGTGDGDFVARIRRQVSDPRNLDASVEEVFRLMLGVDCRARGAPAHGRWNR